MFTESRLLGVRVDEKQQEAVLSIVDTGGTEFIVRLCGLEKLLVEEFRQQNVIEEMRHWRVGALEGDWREAVNFLIAGAASTDSDPQLAKVVAAVVDRIARGELELIEISAVYGAQVLASFASMAINR